jgi:hypothetical protein
MATSSSPRPAIGLHCAGTAVERPRDPAGSPSSRSVIAAVGEFLTAKNNTGRAEASLQYSTAFRQMDCYHFCYSFSGQEWAS